MEEQQLAQKTAAPDASGPENALHAAPLATGGTLYIVYKEALERARPRLEPGDVLVLDDRRTGNPSFQIRDSHAVKSGARKREILQAIVDYDANGPTDPPWRRSMDSLLREWKLHNLAFLLHVYRRSARDVDLDNRDEGKGYLHFFLVAAQRVWERLVARLRRRHG